MRDTEPLLIPVILALVFAVAFGLILNRANARKQAAEVQPIVDAMSQMFADPVAYTVRIALESGEVIAYRQGMVLGFEPGQTIAGSSGKKFEIIEVREPPTGKTEGTVVVRPA